MRRIAVRPQELDLDYVAFVAATRDSVGGGLRLIADLDSLAGIEFDESAMVTEADAEPFVARLQEMADTEFRLTTHLTDLEGDNQRSGRAQAALALETAYGLITGRQKFGNADDNFWKELDACWRLVAERTA